MLPGEIKYTTFLEQTSRQLAARFESLTRDTSGFIAYAASAIESVEVTVIVGSTTSAGVFSGEVVDGYPDELDLEYVWFDELQPWDEDSRGYNFRWRMPADALAADTAGSECQVEIKITLVSDADNPIRQLLRGPIANVFGA